MAHERFRGVHRHKDGNWVATMRSGGKSGYLGYFSCLEDARDARLKAEISLYGRPLERLAPQFDDGIVKIPLHGRGLKFHGWAVIEAEDWPKVAGVAWTLSKTGYVVGRPSMTSGVVKMHRIILGVGAGVVVDHINRNPLDNRRCNLRICQPADNAKNTGLGRNNGSGFKGVSRTASGRWRARITVNWQKRSMNSGPDSRT